MGVGAIPLIVRTKSTCFEGLRLGFIKLSVDGINNLISTGLIFITISLLRFLHNPELFADSETF